MFEFLRKLPKSKSVKISLLCSEKKLSMQKGTQICQLLFCCDTAPGPGSLHKDRFVWDCGSRGSIIVEKHGHRQAWPQEHLRAYIINCRQEAEREN